MGHIYKDSFFDYVDHSSTKSAIYFIKNIHLPFEIKTVLDVGCGRGAWLAQWEKQGKIILGIDGEYVNKSNLLINKNYFIHRDISQNFHLDEKYDLVQCLEVAEHIDAENADTLIDNLVSHGDFIIFSAATPGQGGEFHVNEQPLSYWVEKFNQKNYLCFDIIRPQIVNERNIEPWYRYNSLLFVNGSKVGNLDIDSEYKIVNKNTDLNKIVSLSWRMRNLILGCLPKPSIDILVKIKHSYIRNKKK